jgi:hypothetical protein
MAALDVIAQAAAEITAAWLQFGTGKKDAESVAQAYEIVYTSVRKKDREME